MVIDEAPRPTSRNVISSPLFGQTDKLLILHKNLILILIISLSFFLRVIGLTPNFSQHPDEPGVILPAAKIAINILLYQDPNPNIRPNPSQFEPYPFKYSSTIYYMHSLIEIIVLGGGYIFYKFTGYTFALSQAAFGQPNLEEFLNNIGPNALADNLIWFHRFLSAILGTGTVFLVYKTTLLLFKNRTIALLAAAALAIMPHHVRDSHYATVTITQTFFFLLAFYFSARFYQQTNIRNCILAGVSAGFATSIKYFPLPILPLLFFLLLSRKKLNTKVIIFIFLAILLGYFIGMPYVLRYFQEMIDAYKISVNFYAPDQTANQSIFQRILPSYLHGYHLLFLFRESAGPILTTIGITGIIVGIRKQWRLTTISLLIAPLANLFFISFYLEAIYQTLIVPILPFLAVFIGIGSSFLLTYVTKITKKKVLGITIVIFLFIIPLVDSTQASFACTKKITEYEAHDWIAENIPNKAVLAYQPGMRLPSQDFTFLRSEVKGNFLLSEVQNSGAEYIALHSGLTDRYPLWADDNLFFSDYIKKNEFTRLVLKEFRQNALLLKSFARPTMCVNSRIYIYKIPKPLSSAQTPIAEFKFDNPNTLTGWKLGKIGVPSGTNIELVSKNNNKFLRYSFDTQTLSQQINNSFIGGTKGLPFSFYGTPLRSPFISINQNKKYSAILKAKREGISIDQLPDGLLKLDFYEGTNQKPILTRFSPRLKPKIDYWQEVIITAQAPDNAKFLTVSFQITVATKNSEYLIQQINLLEE